MGDIEVEFTFFKKHVTKWNDYQHDLQRYHHELVIEQIPRLSSRLPKELNTMIDTLNEAHVKYEGNLADASVAAGKIADALYDTARKYFQTDADNAAEAKKLMSDIDSGL